MPVDNSEITFTSRFTSVHSDASNPQAGAECVTVKVILNDVVDDDGDVIPRKHSLGSFCIPPSSSPILRWRHNAQSTLRFALSVLRIHTHR